MITTSTLIISLWVGLIVGIYVSTPETAGLYGVSVVFLVQVNDNLQWLLKQMIVLESIMVNVERAFVVVHLEGEKDLRTSYD